MAAFPEGSTWPLDGSLDLDLAEPVAHRPFAVYVHVPFCTVRCGYCDFNTYTKDFGPGADRASYTDSVAAEIEISRRVLTEAELLPRPIESIFFGGGTPSLLEPSAIGEIITRLDDTFGVTAGAEITLEVNPETATYSRMTGFQSAGVNRVSVGMQSSVPRVLDVLDRQHHPAKVTETIQISKDLGLRNSVDLIYGAPTETLEEWKRSVEDALTLEPDHLSAYSLIVEQGTKMAAMITRGELPQTDPDLDADKYRLADQTLATAGYQWYEISNFAKTPSDRSVHNLAYWRDWDWWGYGPGAHSHVGRQRWWNVKHPLAYAARLAEGTSPGLEGEALTEEDRRTERVMLGIRTLEGLPAGGVPAEVAHSLVDDGLVEADQLERGRLVLTLNGRLLADHVTRMILGWP
ncbi:radical SAM family heme chaperone HemW [Actinomycetaceae bacterium MB13-C1-2]|nr:radical SAM family heme chaperone HemW [Actinomycetaceae bacterium MB13-C1-2]